MFDRSISFCLLLGGISLAGASCGGGSRADQTPCEIASDCGAGYVCSSAGVCASRTASSNQGVSCRTQLDCEPGQACLGGFCSSGSSGSTSCTNLDDCPGGQYCQFGTQRCVECLTNAQCPRGEVCLGNGTCGASSDGGGGGAVGGSCTSSVDCNGQVCVRGQCLPCAVNSDCREGESCRGNQCVVTDGGSPFCQSQRDCDPYGNICNTVSGRCEPCANSGQCGVGRTCTNGVCRRSSSGGGGGGNSGAECESRTDCTGNFACWIGTCSPCYSDVMCTDLGDIFGGPKICDVTTGQCGPAECVNASECAPGQGCWGNGHCGECTTNSTCRPGEQCNDGVCEAPASTGCASNADCTNGQVCSAGSCSACTKSGQCNAGFICTDGACTPDAGDGTPPGGGTGGSTPLGGACNPSSPTCADGSFCITVGGQSKCSRACVGNGKGGDDDCPTGMACYDFASGAFDGSKFCVTAEQLAQTTPGSPFTTAPGGACSAVSNSCQTSFCQNGGVCSRACMANRDCTAGEVCFAVLDGNNVSSGYHACVASDTTTYLPAGASCTSNLECDSGVCTGFCSNSGNPCDDSGDCGLGGTCNGQCANHCRTSSDCELSETCLPWATIRNGSDERDWTPVCRSGTGGSKANGQSCTGDGECASWWCVSGICTEPCGSNADCTGALASQSCGPVTVTDAAGDPVYSMSFCVY